MHTNDTEVDQTLRDFIQTTLREMDNRWTVNNADKFTYDITERTQKDTFIPAALNGTGITVNELGTNPHIVKTSVTFNKDTHWPQSMPNLIISNDMKRLV